MSSIDRLREWLLADTLPVWLEKGYDRANRSFHERLNFDFSPVTEGGKRVLVQARQIYTYSSSASSIAGALDAAQSAFEFTEAKYRHPAGGWRHRVTHEGAPLDDSRDLYDQAFVVFACAVLYRATGREDVLAAALETLRYLEAERSHPAGGFTEIVPGDGSAFEGPRRQNPHMHLFEAMLALHESTDDDSHLEMATRLFELTRSKFIVDNTLREYFTDALDPVQGEAGEIVEPGHHMEWVWLLHRYAVAADAPAAAALAGNLYEFSLTHGYDAVSGGLHDEVTACGDVYRDDRRLWPQTEALKAHVARLQDAGDDAARNRLEGGIESLFRYHLIGPPGGWREHINSDGENFYGSYPASTLYHLASAVGELERISDVR